ncbi:hypothetical protein PTKIN_Ptkin08bG0092400 [Pterospermum kingtungense]
MSSTFDVGDDLLRDHHAKGDKAAHDPVHHNGDRAGGDDDHVLGAQIPLNNFYSSSYVEHPGPSYEDDAFIGDQEPDPSPHPSPSRVSPLITPLYARDPTSGGKDHYDAYAADTTSLSSPIVARRRCPSQHIRSPFIDMEVQRWK